MAGFCSGKKGLVYYRASGVILNHNFTKEFFKKDQTDCESCKVLADDVRQGASIVKC